MNLLSKNQVTVSVSLCMLLSGTNALFPTPIAIAGTVKTSKLTTSEGFIEQTPKFDTRVANFQFQLGVDQNVLRGSERKNLLHAKAKLRTLRAKADQFYLKTTRDDVSLKAQTAAAAANMQPLQGKANNKGTNLQAKVEKNDNLPLQARAPEIALTPLNTFERNVHAPFQLDLDKLMLKVAPNLTSAIDAEIDNAPVKAADRIARRIKEMEPLLNARVPNPAMPALPPRVKVDANLTHGIDSETKNSQSGAHSAAAEGTAKIDKSLEQGQRMHSNGQMLDSLMGALMAPFKKSDGNSEVVHSANNIAEKGTHEMDSQMLHIAKQPSSISNIDTELDKAKNSSRDKVAITQPGMDAVLTHVRNLPQKSIPGSGSLPNAGINTDVDDVVPWDKWHSNFARLAHDPIFANVSKSKIPSGADSVQITVTRAHVVTVTLVKPSNPVFDNAIVSAYRSLSGNSNLEFPRLSHRQSITFVVDNEHRGSGIPTGVESKPSVGDKEVIEHHI